MYKILIYKEDEFEKIELLINIEKYIKDVNPSLYLYSHPYLKFFEDDTECHSDYSRNPWELLRTEFLHVMSSYPKINMRDLSISYAWFCNNQRLQDWVKN